MNFRFLYKYILAFSLILFLGSAFYAKAQEKPDYWVNILEMSTELKKDTQGAWYYEVSGKIQRGVDDDMYLMLRNAKGVGAPIQLVAYYGGSPINIRFPNCDDSQYFNCSEVATTKAVLEPGVAYELYFSLDSGGYQPISDIFDNLQTVPQSSTASQTQGGGASANENTQTASTNNGSGAQSATRTTASSANQQTTDQEGTELVPLNCGYDIKTLANRDGTGTICGFADLIRLIQRIIEYIFVLILPIAALVFAYAGFLYLTSSGNVSKRDAARRAMTNVLIGIIIVMLAWIAVKTILVSLGVDESFLIYLDIRQ